MSFAAGIVDWAALGKVILFSFIAVIVVSAAYSFGILGATQFAEARRSSRSGAAVGFALLTGVCGAVVIAAVVFGIGYLVS
ncbi:MAG: hypothetical protein H0V29_04605 [Thermoleophilaceae bacterium]|nr:hypothetical protein [Thermoleophilaceae bacterium]